jgi:hypothetical protein
MTPSACLLFENKEHRIIYVEYSDLSNSSLNVFDDGAV